MSPVYRLNDGDRPSVTPKLVIEEKNSMSQRLVTAVVVICTMTVVVAVTAVVVACLMWAAAVIYGSASDIIRSA